MDYLEYQYLYPPRPEQAIPQQMLKMFASRGYSAQVKKNGTCTMIFSLEDVIFKTRHNDDHKAWSGDFLKPFFHRFRGSVFVGELMHSKVSGIRDQLYLFDIIVWEHNHLVNSSFTNRQALLQDLLGTGDQTWDAVRVHENVSYLQNICSTDIVDSWHKLSGSDEGLVLKDPNSKLLPCFRQSANSGWQIKCRKPSKNYSF